MLQRYAQGVPLAGRSADAPRQHEHQEERDDAEGSVLFGSINVTGNTQAAVADAFTSASANALAVSAAFSVVAFFLVFMLPRRVSTPTG